MPRVPVQSSRLRLEAIEDGVVRLAGPLFRAVLEISGAPPPLDDDVRREAVLAGYAGFLNSLNFPIQVLVRSVPVDLGRYLSGIEERASHALPDALTALARDHVAFVHGLARQRTLLERRLYLIVPAEAPATVSWWQLRRRRRGNAPERAAARRQLTLRCEEVARQLARCQVTVRRLDDTALAQLYLACWAPERARLQRVRQQVDEYTTLVVTADRSGGASDGASGPAPVERSPSPGERSG
jgi:hypothetical protein